MEKSHLLVREESITNLEDLLCKETNNLFKDVIASTTREQLVKLSGYNINENYTLVEINPNEKELTLFNLNNDENDVVEYDFLSQQEQHDLLEHIIFNIMK